MGDNVKWEVIQDVYTKGCRQGVEDAAKKMESECQNEVCTTTQC